VTCVSFPEKCARATQCKVRDVWIEATQALFDKLDGITIADILETEDDEPC
jgi:DNA-binding IscR family transcriptional regulator